MGGSEGLESVFAKAALIFFPRHLTESVMIVSKSSTSTCRNLDKSH